MTILTDSLNHLITMSGFPLRVRYYTETIGSVYDDERTLTKSGTDIYISGIILNLSDDKGSSDENLREEGRIRFGDSKLYINGSIQTNSGNRVFTFATSGTDVVYREILPGVDSPQYQGIQVIKSIYVRELQTGSLF